MLALSCNPVWEMAGETRAEARNLALRSSLMLWLCEYIDGTGLSLEEASVELGVTSQRMMEIKKGRIDRFSLDTLIRLATHTGTDVELLLNCPLGGEDSNAPGTEETWWIAL